ncbi:MAG: hypothetical protein HY735_23465 [Verrucomicrobia bacterium]|nr:hypothetical protein [Verrucomicrobiota bacterium]
MNRSRRREEAGFGFNPGVRLVASAATNVRFVESKSRIGPRLVWWLTVLAVSMGLLRAADLSQLKVLYVGDAASPRAADFKAFLELNAGQAAVANRNGFDPRQAAGFDVVLLDWPQTGQQLDSPSHKSPLGPRDQWVKPTVLLGSAGLNLAVAWMAKGGSG